MDLTATIRVNCDLCGHSFTIPKDIEELANWLDEPCLECGKGVLVTKEDLDACEVGLAVERAAITLNKVFGVKDDRKTIIRMDTAPLRDGKPATFTPIATEQPKE